MMTAHEWLRNLASQYCIETGHVWHWLDGPRRHESTARFRNWLLRRRVAAMVWRLIETNDRDARMTNKTIGAKR